MNNGCRRVLRR